MKIINLFFSLFFLLSLNAKAQSGCIVTYDTYIADYKVYTKSLGTFTSCNGFNNVERFDPNVYTTFSPQCTVSPNPLSLITSPNYRNCIVGGGCGVKGNYVIDNCPLDGYAWAALLLVGGAVFSLLRRRSRPLLA
ncbi:hypothetical protein [Pedobacter sp. ASV12]|uniref:hypothetical protein n=1 Tax=Pedobacter sp. ASV12 TaxID=2795120 RepID=UPI0018ECBBFE|nr:hypothetical protein [Pedobacter sp. ASV12]